MSDTNRPSPRRAVAIAISVVALAGMSLGTALAAQTPAGAPGARSGWADLARVRMLIAETAGADRDELATLNGWLDDDGAETDVETPETETPDADETEAADEVEARDPPEKPEAVEEPESETEDADNDDQGENEQEGADDDQGEDEHDGADAGEHDGGDSGDAEEHDSDDGGD